MNSSRTEISATVRTETLIDTSVEPLGGVNEPQWISGGNLPTLY